RMRTTRILWAVGCVGAIALSTLLPAKAQYYYPRPPDYGFDYPPPDDRYGYGWTWNDCPPGWTVQGGNLQSPCWRRMAHLEWLSTPLQNPRGCLQTVSRISALNHCGRP